MPSFCAVATCNDRYGHSENISFHKFPLKRLHLLKQWEGFIQKQRGEDWHASRWSSLCSRHFVEEDFRSLCGRRTLKKTAVPSILRDNGTKANGSGKSKKKQHEKVVNTVEDTREKEFKEILAIKERLEDTAVAATTNVLNVPKTNCRLCGISSMPSANFFDNYELYGLLQKCFPTINIQQEDALPKVMCASCHKHLEDFGLFVDRVWIAQTELQRKFLIRASEKPVKIKQEPLVRVKQEVAESGYEVRQQVNGFGVGNEDYDFATDVGVHEEGDDQKYEFCDFPIINDCDIMEIINLDDPFINIPDDDNTTTQNEEDEILNKPINDSLLNYMPTAHELLQTHLLMEEHNYAYVDADEFKEERHIYKTEKYDNDERLTDYIHSTTLHQEQLPPISYSKDVGMKMDQHHDDNFENTDLIIPAKTCFEKRALKPIVTSVSAIQQPTKSSSSGIVVLNESIVKSGCGFQLHACMVCQLKFFSVESLRQHYTQTHGTPMVTVPGENIFLERVTQNTCKMEKEFTENTPENPKSAKTNDTETFEELNCEKTEKQNNLKETKEEKPDNFVKKSNSEDANLPQVRPSEQIGSTVNATKSCKESSVKKSVCEAKQNILNNKNKIRKTKIPIKCRKYQNVSLNIMANQYQQLKKLYQKLQKKCTNLEQNVEQLQLLPTTTVSKRKIRKSNTKTKSKDISNKAHNTSGTTSRDNTIIKKLHFTCVECSKSFSNSSCLRQHKITHTEERKHHCSLCQRTFKRRNGLLQHLKGFHLKVKPFSCPVCKHSYALKCDMLRCKHSTMRNLQISCEKLNNVVNEMRVNKKNLIQ